MIPLCLYLEEELRKQTTHCLMPPTIQLFDADEAMSADLMTLKPQTE